jgi:hypothetical protein
MCVTTPALNDTLAHSNYSLIARHESNTGYVAVLDNFAEGYRVLRCDHSLLGGEWQRPPKGLEHQITGRFREPIYSVFILLEAVRLAVPAPKNPQTRALSMSVFLSHSLVITRVDFYFQRTRDWNVGGCAYKTRSRC